MRGWDRGGVGSEGRRHFRGLRWGQGWQRGGPEETFPEFSCGLSEKKSRKERGGGMAGWWAAWSLPLHNKAPQMGGIGGADRVGSKWTLVRDVYQCID